MKYDEAVIVSLYPAALRASRRGFSGSPFEVAPCRDLDKPQILVVRTQTEVYEEAMDRKVSKDWPAEQVANDLVHEMADGLLGSDKTNGATPAIWVSQGAELLTSNNEKAIREKVRDFGGAIVASSYLDKSSKTIRGEWYVPGVEIADHKDAQDRLGHNLIQGARREWNQDTPQSKQAVDAMRHVLSAFARWFGLTEEPWQTQASSSKDTKCPECKKPILSGAMKCGECGAVTDIPAWAKRQAAQKAALESAMGGDEEETTRAVPVELLKPNTPVRPQVSK